MEHSGRLEHKDTAILENSLINGFWFGYLTCDLMKEGICFLFFFLDPQGNCF